jgi:EAL domain-containing protein (putative c-di-GMP-specific phosphodiesterase class I)
LSLLKARGVRIAIDDFGTGYSSLAYLHRFPVDTLKIDRTFIHQIQLGGSGAAIVGAIIGLAHKLDIEVVAEGVETEEQLAFLRREGCDVVQGFLAGRPAPPNEMRI